MCLALDTAKPPRHPTTQIKTAMTGARVQTRRKATRMRVAPTAPQRTNTPHRTRTCNPLIKSQLLDSTSAESGGTYACGAAARSAGDSNGSEDRLLDPDLATVIEAWPSLPEHIRAAVLALLGVAGHNS